MNRLTGRSSYYSIIVMDSLILEGLGIDYFTVWILKIDSRYKFLNIKNKYCGVDTIFLIKTTLYEIATHTSVIAKTTHWVIGYPTLSYRFTTYSVEYP